MDLDSEKAAGLTMPATAWETRVFNAARRWLAEDLTFAWVKSTNLFKKVAPRAERVRQSLSYHALNHAASRGCDTANDESVRNSWCTSKWLQRFKRRWALRVGKLQVRDHVTETELQQKARVWGQSWLAMCA